MQFSLWLALVGAGTLISFTPGAGAINTMSNALNSGFRRSIWGILGQQAALLIHIVIVALGVGLLVASSPIAFNMRDAARTSNWATADTAVLISIFE